MRLASPALSGVVDDLDQAHAADDIKGNKPPAKQGGGLGRGHTDHAKLILLADPRKRLREIIAFVTHVVDETVSVCPEHSVDRARAGARINDLDPRHLRVMAHDQIDVLQGIGDAIARRVAERAQKHQGAFGRPDGKSEMMESETNVEPGHGRSSVLSRPWSAGRRL